MGGGSGGMNAICSQLEVADYIISGESVDTFRYYIDVSLWFDSFSTGSFQENRSRPFIQEKPTNCGTKTANVLANF